MFREIGRESRRSSADRWLDRWVLGVGRRRREREGDGVVVGLCGFGLVGVLRRRYWDEGLLWGYWLGCDGFLENRSLTGSIRNTEITKNLNETYAVKTSIELKIIKMCNIIICVPR